METGRRQLAVTNVSRKHAVPCADVQLALGQLVVLLHPPHHLPLNLPTKYKNDELDQHERSIITAKAKYEVLLTDLMWASFFPLVL